MIEKDLTYLSRATMHLSEPGMVSAIWLQKSNNGSGTQYLIVTSLRKEERNIIRSRFNLELQKKKK